VTFKEPEFDRHELNLLLAYRLYQASINRFGTPIAEATDPANQYKYHSDPAPTMDWQEWEHDRVTRAYYAREDPENPMPRAAHRWAPPRLT
jgi:hypothetical protein